MKTTRTLSNISYNSPEYFGVKIKQAIDNRVLDWAYWIIHEPDVDEKKPHIHFCFKPSSRMDTAEFRQYLNEIDPAMPDKPRTCTPKFNPMNSMDDWLLYAIHEEAYLASKNQHRNKHYHFDDICTTDWDALQNDIANIDFTRYRRLQLLDEAVKDNTPFYVLVQNGTVPIAQRGQYEYQYNAIHDAIYGNHDDSGRKQTHE